MPIQLTPSDYRATQGLIQQLAPQVEGVPHNVVLAALMAMYRCTAHANPCCTQGAGDTCLSVSAGLLQVAAGVKAPAGTPVH